MHHPEAGRVGPQDRPAHQVRGVAVALLVQRAVGELHRPEMGVDLHQVGELGVHPLPAFDDGDQGVLVVQDQGEAQPGLDPGDLRVDEIGVFLRLETDVFIRPLLLPRLSPGDGLPVEMQGIVIAAVHAQGQVPARQFEAAGRAVLAQSLKGGLAVLPHDDLFLWHDAFLLSFVLSLCLYYKQTGPGEQGGPGPEPKVLPRGRRRRDIAIL